MNIKLLIVFLLISNGLQATRKKLRKKKKEKGAVAARVVRLKLRPHGWATHVKIDTFRENFLVKKEK
jgi:hypothetical protein